MKENVMTYRKAYFYCLAFILLVKTLPYGHCLGMKINNDIQLLRYCGGTRWYGCWSIGCLRLKPYPRATQERITF